MLVCGEKWEQSMWNQVTKTERFIVHNMKLYEDEWQEQLDAAGFQIHFRARTLQLTDEQMKDFWLYREFGVILPKCERYDDGKSDTNVDYTPIFEDPRFRVGGKLTNEDGSEAPLRGTAYFFDEIHNVYPSRQWHNTPRHFTFYTSQHGKLNDSFVATTQAIKNCDPVVYRLAQDFTYCRNLRLEKFGRFKRGDGFQAKTYMEPRTQNGQEFSSVLDYSFDAKVAARYDTSAGIGMPGGGTADKGHSVKGVPLKTVWVMIALAICGVYYFFNYVMPKYTHKFLGNVIGKGRLADPKKTAAVPQNVEKLDTAKTVDVPFSVPAIANSPSEMPPISQVRQPGQQGAEVRVRGYVLSGGKVNLILTDGRTLIEGDPGFESLQRNGAMVDGKKIYMLTPSPSPAKPVESGRGLAPSGGLEALGVPSEAEALSREAKISQSEDRSAAYRPISPNTPSSMSAFDSRPPSPKTGVSRTNSR